MFGKQLGTTFPEGLVDVITETKFDEKLEILLSKRLKNEHEVQSFILWFIKNKVSVIKKSMLRPIHEEAGLGFPKPFYTNASKSLNSIMKSKVNKCVVNFLNSLLS